MMEIMEKMKKETELNTLTLLSNTNVLAQGCVVMFIILLYCRPSLPCPCVPRLHGPSTKLTNAANKVLRRKLTTTHRKTCNFRARKART